MHVALPCKIMPPLFSQLLIQFIKNILQNFHTHVATYLLLTHKFINGNAPILTSISLKLPKRTMIQESSQYSVHFHPATTINEFLATKASECSGIFSLPSCPKKIL